MARATISSSPTPGKTTSTSSPSHRANTPSSDGDVFNAGSSLNELNLEHLVLNSTASPGAESDIYLASSHSGSDRTPEAETIPASTLCSPSPFVPILTPRTSSGPSTVSEQASSSPSSATFHPGLPINFSLSISTHGSPSQTSFQFVGADTPLPSVEDPSTPTPSPRLRTASFTFAPPKTSPGTPSRVASQSGVNTPTRQTTPPTQGQGDSAGNLASQLRNIQITDSPHPKSPRNDAGPPSETSSQVLSPTQDDARPSNPSRPSTPRYRRSSSRVNQPAHNVSDEEVPDDEFSSPTFQRAFADTREMMATMERALGSSNLHLEPDSTIRRLYEKAEELAQFHCPPTRTVGFVGDSGVGKSSLINSLLDRRGLARASSSGVACTCVVTEYHFHDQDTFTIQVTKFSSQELRIQLTELVQSYRRRHIGPPADDPQEKKDIDDRAKVASDTFGAMFRGPDHFCDGSMVLGQSEEDIINTMVQWAQELGPSSVTLDQTFTTQKDAAGLLIKLTSEQGFPASQRPSLWPYIKKIRVFHNAHILSRGLVLVDLPGLRDLNSARQNITERYLLQCDEIFAVCCIDRAITDPGVEIVFDLARQARVSNVGIVCTRADAIEASEVATDWKEDSKAWKILKVLIEQKDTAAEEERQIRNRVAELKAAIGEDDPFPEEADELARLSLRQSAKEEVIVGREYELKRHLMTTRNKMVQKQLFDLYKDTIRGGRDLKVFCVSNTMYWDHRNEAWDKARPYLELAGIISLRKHCMAMVADSQLRIARNYMENDMRSLVSSVELWVQSGVAGTETAERKTTIRETLDVVEGRLRRDLSGSNGTFYRLAQSLKDEFRQRIHGIARIRVRYWRQGAISAGNEWSCWWHPTYAAFCRNYGTHETGKAGYHNWNEEAMTIMTEDLSGPWEAFESYLTGQRVQEAESKVEEVMDWAVEYLDNQLGENEPSLRPLRQGIDSEGSLLVAEVEDAWEVFSRRLRILQVDALSSLRSSFIGQGMESSYARCRAESGTGSDVRRKSIISQTLADHSLFENIMRRFKARFKELSVELQTSLQEAVDRHLAAITQTMDLVRDENVIAESERDTEFRKLVEDEVERVRARLQVRN